MALSQHLDESVVVLLAVLGIKNVEVLATAISFTAGLQAWRPANVSQLLTSVEECLITLDSDFRSVFSSCAFDYSSHDDTSSCENVHGCNMS